MLHLSGTIKGNYFHFIDCRVLIIKISCAISYGNLPEYIPNSFGVEDTKKLKQQMKKFWQNNYINPQ